MALSIINTSKINRKGATTNRIMVELLFRNATLAAKHKPVSLRGVCVAFRLESCVYLVYDTVRSKAA